VNCKQVQLESISLLQPPYDQLGHNDASFEEFHQEADVEPRAEWATIQQLRRELADHKADVPLATKVSDQMTDEAIKVMSDDAFQAIKTFVDCFFGKNSFGMCIHSALHAFHPNRTPEYDMLPEDLKLWMDEYMPYSHSSRKRDWTNIASGLISKVLVTYSDNNYFIGCSGSPAVMAAVDLKRLLQCE
jgi:hypothetical protein